MFVGEEHEEQKRKVSEASDKHLFSFKGEAGDLGQKGAEGEVGPKVYDYIL
jgi:hypothetical protein